MLVGCVPTIKGISPGGARCVATLGTSRRTVTERLHNVLLIEDNAGDARLILEMVKEDPDAPFVLHTADRQ